MNIDDLIDEVRQRLRSPLFGSFLISWLIINWRIPVALAFYKKEDLITEGYKTLNGFIEAQLHFMPTIVTPICMAIVYCFILKPLMILSITAIETSTNKRSYRIAEKGTVPMQKFLTTKLKYEKLVKDIENSDNNENTLKEQINDLAQKNVDFKMKSVEDEAKITELTSEIDKLNSKLKFSSDSSILNGDWSVKIDEDEGYWNIENNIINEEHNINFDIIHFHHNTDKKEIKLVYKEQNNFENIEFQYCTLSYRSSFTTLKGMINFIQPITLSKKIEIIP